ncbi:hypothetical protein KCU64_g11629, partial [Aureobasidium melanogenum]
MSRQYTNSKPPLPDLYKTFWKPSFPDGRTFAVKRKHPILNWGDYNDLTGLYIWQNERWKGNPEPEYIRRCKQALEGMFYGVENNPRCRRCDKSDRFCTNVVGSVPGTTTCARCRLGPDKGCCFANGGKRTSSAMDTIKEPSQNQDDEDGHSFSHRPPVIHHRSVSTHGRTGAAIEQSEDHPSAKRQKISSLKSRSILQEDSDDEVPLKTILGQRKAKARHGANTMQPRSMSPPSRDTIQVAGSQSKDRRRTVIEIPDSPSPSPLFCSTTESPELDKARYTEVEFQLDDFSTVTGVADYTQIQERLRVLETENQSEKRRNQDRVRRLEEQISVLREEQDHKLNEKIRELRKNMNYGFNQLMMQQPKEKKKS